MAAITDLYAAPSALPTYEDIERRRAELLATSPKPSRQNASVQPSKPSQAAALSVAPEETSWPELAEPALYGLAGQVVRALEPCTETDPPATLLQFLAAFGNLLGPAPYVEVASTRHRLNLFVVLVGQSSKARKGTSWRQIERLLSEVDARWITERVTNARLTADGLIRALRDPRDDNPPTDRRLLVLAEEFASVLQPISRNHGHLAPTLLSAWDHGHLRSLDRYHPLQATGTHITLIGHATRYAITPFLNGNIAHNGFANRCLWACVRRSQYLPNGGDFPAANLSGVVAEMRRALVFASTAKYPFARSHAAQQLWEDRYFDLSQGGFGLHGAATGRGEAQVLRLSALYTALDATNMIEQPHLQAALAVWDYCSAAAGVLFVAQPEDRVAATIRNAIEGNASGLSRDDIRKLFSGHVESATIDAALEQLTINGTIVSRTSPTGGRPRTTWEISQTSEQEFLEEEISQLD